MENTNRPPGTSFWRLAVQFICDCLIGVFVVLFSLISFPFLSSLDNTIHVFDIFILIGIFGFPIVIYLLYLRFPKHNSSATDLSLTPKSRIKAFVTLTTFIVTIIWTGIYASTCTGEMCSVVFPLSSLALLPPAIVGSIYVVISKRPERFIVFLILYYWLLLIYVYGFFIF